MSHQERKRCKEEIVEVLKKHTYAEAGKMFGVTRERIRQLVAQHNIDLVQIRQEYLQQQYPKQTLIDCVYNQNYIIQELITHFSIEGKWKYNRFERDIKKAWGQAFFSELKWRTTWNKTFNGIPPERIEQCIAEGKTLADVGLLIGLNTYDPEKKGSSVSGRVRRKLNFCGKSEWGDKLCRKDFIDWTEDKIALLGTGTLEEVAQEIGCTPSAVQQKMKKLGIESFSGKKWTEDQVALLGTDTDRAIGEKIGRSESAVFKRRKKLGIKAFCKQNK